MNVMEKDEKFFGRGAPAIDLQVTKARESYIYDQKANRYIDFIGGAGVGIFGWGNPRIEAAIRKQDRPSYIYPNLYYKAWAELAETLARITPEHLTRVFRCTGGSEAVEAAIQIAMMYTRRKKFLSIEGSYHGNTLGGLSLGSSSNKERFPNLLPGCEKIELPLDDLALERIEEKLQHREVAAFFMEPVLTNLGVIIPGKSFMKRLDQLCKAYGTLLVMDEVVTGFGRTGSLFGSSHYQIKPDLLCLAKGMSAGYAGIGATMTTSEIAEKVTEKIGLYSTYGWHPISVDATTATIRLLLEEQDSIFSNMERLSGIFQEKLEAMEFRHHPEIRISGLAIGIDVQQQEYASQIKKNCLDNGLLINNQGASLVLLPALNIAEEVVQEGLDLLDKSL